jgi:hypothetical protein
MGWFTLLSALCLVTGILLALCAVLLLLIRVVSWIRRSGVPVWLEGILEEPSELFAAGLSAVGVVTGLLIDRPPAVWQLVRDAADIALLVDAVLLVPVFAAAILVMIVLIIYLFLIELPSELYALIQGRRIFRIPLSLVVLTLLFGLIVTLIVALLGPIALWSAAALEWVSAMVPEWVTVGLRWINAGALLVANATTFALLAIASALLLIFLVGLIETLIFARPRERSLFRWFEAPWNDIDPDRGSAEPRDSESRPERTAPLFRPDQLLAVLAGAMTGGGERPVFRGTTRRAKETARERETFLQEHLRRYADTLPDREIVEVPPRFVESYEPRSLSPPSANARLVTLLHQQLEDPSLLFGRVVDAIRCFLRLRSSVSDLIDQAPRAEIVLRKLRWWERWIGEYPWIVLVRTENTREFVDFLEPLRSWLGIGVRIARPLGWTEHRSCTHSQARGTVAGYLGGHDDDSIYPLTCAHVLPPQCTQHHVTRDPRTATEQPDAALLQQHPCVGDFNRDVVVGCVEEPELRRLWVNAIPVVRAGGYSRRVLGYVKYHHTSYTTQTGAVEDFPACVVKTRRIRYAWGRLPLPLLRWPFSREGDSGSWVMVPKSDGSAPSWVGLVAAGGEGDDIMESYVLKASALLDYFRRQLPGSSLVPHLTEDF